MSLHLIDKITIWPESWEKKIWPWRKKYWYST